MNNNEACAEYFRGNSAYRRCFSEFEKKWKTYGKVTGIITLKNTSEEERRAIGGILGKTFYENTIRFPFAEFEKGLQYTKFAPVDFEQVLEAYFGRKMLTTQERQKEAERGKADFFETVESYLTECTGPDSIAVSWLQDMFSQKKYGYQTVIREYGRDREKTEKLLKTVGKAILLLEDIRETEEEYPLAVFPRKYLEIPITLIREQPEDNYWFTGCVMPRKKIIRQMPISGENYCCPTESYRIIFPLSCISMDCDYRLTVTGTRHMTPFADDRSPVLSPWKICRS